MTTEGPWWKQHVTQIVVGLFVTIIGGVIVILLTKTDSNTALTGAKIEFIYQEIQTIDYEFEYKCDVDPCYRKVNSEKFLSKYSIYNASDDAGKFSIYIPIDDRSNYLSAIIDKSEKIKIANFENSSDFVSKYGFIRLDVQSIDEHAELIVIVEGEESSPSLGEPYADIDTIRFFLPWQIGYYFELES